MDAVGRGRRRTCRGRSRGCAYARGDGAVRHRQARPALRTRDPRPDAARWAETRRRSSRRRARRGGRLRGIVVPGGAALHPQGHRRAHRGGEGGAGGWAHLGAADRGRLGRAGRQAGRAGAARRAGLERGRPAFSPWPARTRSRRPRCTRCAARSPAGRRSRPTTAHAFVWIVDFPAVRARPGDRPARARRTTRSPRRTPTTWTSSRPTRDACRALHYDAVYNGNELGSGSIRITDPATAAAHLRAARHLRSRRSGARFGFLLDGLAAGRPAARRLRARASTGSRCCSPGAASLRDVIAFPRRRRRARCSRARRRRWIPPICGRCTCSRSRTSSHGRRQPSPPLRRRRGPAAVRGGERRQPAGAAAHPRRPGLVPRRRGQPDRHRRSRSSAPRRWCRGCSTWPGWASRSRPDDVVPAGRGGAAGRAAGPDQRRQDRAPRPPPGHRPQDPGPARLPAGHQQPRHRRRASAPRARARPISRWPRRSRRWRGSGSSASSSRGRRWRRASRSAFSPATCRPRSIRTCVRCTTRSRT